MFNISELSAEQKQAAFMIDAPLCILAGAGSGKTRVITYRIAYLVKEKGIWPSNILGVTFTNKAAREMQERVQKLLPKNGKDVLLGTFHGLAARFLRYHGEIIAMPKDFLIYDQDDSTRLIKRILKERFDLSKDEINSEVKKVFKLREQEENSPDNKLGHTRAELIHQIYLERLKKMGAIDFAGLLVKFLELLKSDEGGRILCDRIRHIVVDEYQDINKIQSEIVQILAKNADTAAIVGDDDQSIYGWRGASAHFMQKFLDDFVGAKLYRLEENYRSTEPILDCANALIANNSERLGKNLKSMSGLGPLNRLSCFFRESQEASSIIEQALRLFEEYGSSFEVAVLMRTNAQSRPLEEALHRARLPYRMVGGMRFYDRKEIKDILAVLRSVLYTNSDVDLLRMLNSISLGIGQKTQDALALYAAKAGLTIFQVMADANKHIAALGGTSPKKKIVDLVAKLNEIRSELEAKLSDGQINIMRADEALIYVIDKFGIAKKLEQKNDDESASRLENIEQLVQAALDFISRAQSLDEPTDIRAFLESVALVSKDESVDDQSLGQQVGTITLMTLHAAKGLEFDGVFLIGLEDGVLPHNRSLQGFDEVKRRESLQEERRLLYVGMTRAKKRLFLSFCKERFTHGQTLPSLPSRFIRELPMQTFEARDRNILALIQSYKPIESNMSYSFKESFSKPKAESYRVEYEEEYSPTILIGSRVRHANYQEGTVISLSGSGKMTRAKIKFDCDGQLRVILATHVQGV